MIFRRKGWLRQEFDEKLIKQINYLKSDWDRSNQLYENSLDPFGDLNLQVKIAGAKYVYLLREAKRRNVSLLK